MLTLAELSSVDKVGSAALRKRAHESSRGKHTRQYIVYKGTEEVAFLSVDDVHASDCLFLYEIYVEPSRRRQGIGTELVLAVEDMAVRMGYSRVVLHPKAFDSTVSPIFLKDWYERLGFRPRPGLPDEFEKHLGLESE